MTENLTLGQKRLNVLVDTCNYFNSIRRNAIDSICRYNPLHTNTEGCAVGRLIKDKEICKQLDVDGKYIDRDDAFSLLPIELQELGKDFLRNVQNLHDNSNYWGEKGLTTKGIAIKEDIITKFCSK